MFKKLVIVLSLTFIPSLTAQGFTNKLTGSYYSEGGNVDYNYFNATWSTEIQGSIQLGDLKLDDTEFLFSVSHSRSDYNKKPYENDAHGILKLDLWANKTFSPFMFSEIEFDSTQGLDNRTNVGIGAKYRVLGDLFSISYAFMYENEKYVGWPADTFTRHSLRPKLKAQLTEGVFLQSQLFFKPTVNDLEVYLIDWQNGLSIETKAKWLTVEIQYQYKYNTDPAIKSYELDDQGNKINEKYYQKEDVMTTIGLSITL
ncbi:MAG: DUF481 domain-containing protein [Fidelibacterota bacterium]